MARLLDEPVPAYSRSIASRMIRPSVYTRHMNADPALCYCSLMVARKTRRQALQRIFAVVLIAIILACPRTQAQDPMILGGAFRLVDQTGTTVTDETYRGKWLVIFFGFTHCPDVCPMTLSKITNMMELLGKNADRVQPLFITLDPERDTVTVMRDYIAAFDRRLVGLTGARDAIGAVAKSYGVISNQSGSATDYTIGHSAAVYLVDPDGRYNTMLDPNLSASDMAAWLRALM
jgi:protein SCO1